MTTLAELKAEHDALAKKIAAFEAEKEWPKHEDEYFNCEAFGAQKYKWLGDGFDNACMKQGLVFRTAAEAEKQRQRNIVMKKLRDLAGDFKPDWGAGAQGKFTLYFYHYSKTWRISEVRDVQQPGLIYFHTLQEAQHAIDTLGDELKVLL